MNTLTRSEGHFLKLHSLAATSITQMEGARKFEFQRFEEIVARTSRTDRPVLTGFVLGLMVGRGLVELEPEFVRECAHGRGQSHAPRSRPIPPRDVVEAHGESQRVLMQLDGPVVHILALASRRFKRAKTTVQRERARQAFQVLAAEDIREFARGREEEGFSR